METDWEAVRESNRAKYADLEPRGRALFFLPAFDCEDFAAECIVQGRGYGRSAVEELASSWTLEDYESATDGDGSGISALELSDVDRVAFVFATVSDLLMRECGDARDRWARAELWGMAIADWRDVAAINVSWNDHGFVDVRSAESLTAAETIRDDWQLAYGEHADDCDCSRCIAENGEQ